MIQIGPKYNTDDTLRLSQLFYEAISLTATRSCVQLSTRKQCPCSVIDSMRRGAGMSVVRSRARSQRAKISDLGISNVTLLSHPGGDCSFKFSNIGRSVYAGRCDRDRLDDRLAVTVTMTDGLQFVTCGSKNGVCVRLLSQGERGCKIVV